jgi:hypothetical protein
MAGKPLPIDGFPRDGETRGQESLLVFGPEPWIAKKIGVLRYPEDPLGGKLLPAMGARDPP